MWFAYMREEVRVVQLYASTIIYVGTPAEKCVTVEGEQG
jgi:hypothetical protein